MDHPARRTSTRIRSPRAATFIVLAGMAALAAPQTALAQSAPSTVTKAMAPGIDGVEPLTVLRDRYLFGPILVRGTGGRIHMQFYRGEDHMWKGRASVGYAWSDDEGASWTVAPDAVSSDKPQVYDRFGSFGRAQTGKLVTLFSRRQAPGQKPVIYQTESVDEGRNWRAARPAEVAAGDDAPLKAGWLYPYGAIKRAPGGALVVMAYAAEDNFVLVSRDHGVSWTRYLVISSARPNYSEMGMEALDENHWIAVSRIDGPLNRMAQFVTADAGRSWRLEGELNLLAASDVNVAPTIDVAAIAGRKMLLLAYCDRRPKMCWLRSALPNEVANDPQKWGKSMLFDQGFVGRSGYQSFVPSRDGRRLIGAIVRERSETVSEIVAFRTPDLGPLGQ